MKRYVYGDPVGISQRFLEYQTHFDDTLALRHTCDGQT